MEKYSNNAKGELELIFPTKEYKEQIESYLKEHLEIGEIQLHGAGGLDRIQDFDKWMKKIRDDLSEKMIEEGRVPATLLLGVRKSDNKVIGTIQIRHQLNEKLLKDCGHIGDGVRPSERQKGYATEMIRLALEKARKMGIKRVLMVCHKENIGSRKSIIKNGGELQNEILDEEGKIVQRYWISLKKRYADSVKEFENVIQIEQKIKSINNSDFVGDVYLNHFKQINKPYLVNKEINIQDTEYKWLEFYDYNAKIKLTAIYDENNKIVEWYFDIARRIGKENDIPYEDDMYLDVVLRKDGSTILLDEDELEEAYNRMELTKEDVDAAYKTTKELINKIDGKVDKVKEFTDKYLEEMLK